LAVPVSATTEEPFPEREIGTSTLAPEEFVHFSLELPAEHSLRLVIHQKGVDVTTTLLDGHGRELAVADRYLGETSEEWLEVVTPGAGVYDLKVTASSTPRPPGTFTVQLDHLRPASERDRQVAAAFEIFSRGSRQLPTEDGTDHESLLRDATTRFEALGEPLYQAEALTRLWRYFGSLREKEALWREAIALFQKAGDLPSQAWAQGGLSGNLLLQDRYGEAETYYRANLEITSLVPDRFRRAMTLDGIGKVAANQGRAQEALDFLEEALRLWREHEISRAASTLHELGVVYRWKIHEPETASRFLLRAMEKWQALEDQGRPAPDSSVDKTLGQLAQTYLDLGNLSQARELLQQALDLQSPRSCRVIPTLTKLAELEILEGSLVNARRYLLQAAQNLVQGCPREESSVWLAHLDFFLDQGAPKAALLAADRCTETFHRRGDLLGSAACDSGRARALGTQGETAAAIEAAGRAMAAFEETRPGIYRSDLRTSFFSGVQDIFDVQIALLLDLGDDRAAFETAERARARSLRDGLREAGAAIRRDADPELLKRERSLRRRLDGLDSKARSAPPGSDREATHLRRMQKTLEDLEAIRGAIRREAPRYASLIEEAPISVEQIQEALPPDHLLLKVHLGETDSTLWAVSKDDLQSFRLPPRAPIEALAREANAQLRSLRWSGMRTSLCRLSEIVLGPAQDLLLPGHSLILVLDGALEELAFAALPQPGTSTVCGERPFLGEAHELLHLPSASLLVEEPWAQPRGDSDRPWITMVADPVYSSDDPRLDKGPEASSSFETEALARLPHSAAEAEAVLGWVPEHRGTSLLGIDARRGEGLEDALSSARVLHFAVHGVHEPQPLRSHLALSSYDSEGNSLSGRLFAYELYDFDLAADLVVLSGCETGAGTQVRGEGRVSGLVRGFFYAGAQRVLASLWPVPDAGTAKLMSHFYQGLLEEELSPARALQEAQSELRAQGEPPRIWAGFVLQGSPEVLPPFLP